MPGVPNSTGKLKKWKKQLQKQTARWDHARQQVREEVERLQEAQVAWEEAQTAQGILQRVAQKVQENACLQVASIVSHCLEAVFDNPYQFQIRLERKRGKTEADFSLIRDGVEVGLLDAAGGGVVDVVAFALRLACLVLSRPAPRRLLVVDEPFKHVSEEYRGRVREMLETISQRLQVQIIMVTHSDQLRCGTVLKIE